jgi:hypothetical protein
MHRSLNPRCTLNPRTMSDLLHLTLIGLKITERSSPIAFQIYRVKINIVAGFQHRSASVYLSIDQVTGLTTLADPPISSLSRSIVPSVDSNVDSRRRCCLPVGRASACSVSVSVSKGESDSGGVVLELATAAGSPSPPGATVEFLRPSVAEGFLWRACALSRSMSGICQMVSYVRNHNQVLPVANQIKSIGMEWNAPAGGHNTP